MIKLIVIIFLFGFSNLVVAQPITQAIGRVVVVSTDIHTQESKAKVCSGFLTDKAQFLTSAHCFRPVADATVDSCFVEFNVPLSSSSGGLVFAHDKDRYMIKNFTTVYGTADNCVINQLKPDDKPEIQDDWAILALNPNEITGLSPAQQQQSSFKLTSVNSEQNFSKLNLQFTGYPKLGGAQNYRMHSVLPSTNAYFFKQRPLIIFQRSSVKGDSGAPLYTPNNDDVYGIIIGNLSADVCQRYLNLKDTCSIALRFDSPSLEKHLD